MKWLFWCGFRSYASVQGSVVMTLEGETEDGEMQQQYSVAEMTGMRARPGYFYFIPSHERFLCSIQKLVYIPDIN